MYIKTLIYQNFMFTKKTLKNNNHYLLEFKNHNLYYFKNCQLNI